METQFTEVDIRRDQINSSDTIYIFFYIIAVSVITELQGFIKYNISWSISFCNSYYFVFCFFSDSLSTLKTLVRLCNSFIYVLFQIACRVTIYEIAVLKSFSVYFNKIVGYSKKKIHYFSRKREREREESFLHRPLFLSRSLLIFITIYLVELLSFSNFSSILFSFLPLFLQVNT